MKKVLSDHIQKKKKLLPPLLAFAGEKHKSYSWTQDVMPGLIWIGLIQEMYGMHQGVDYISRLAGAAFKIMREETKPFFCLIDSFSQLSEQQKNELLKSIDAEGFLGEIQKALSGLFYFFPGSPLEFLNTDPSRLTNEQDAQILLNKIIPLLIDRYSRNSTLVLSTGVYLGLNQGKIKIATDKIDMAEKFAHIPFYPDTKKSQMAASSFRSMAFIFSNSGNESKNEEQIKWTKFFWSQLSSQGICAVDYEMEMADVPYDDFGNVVVTFCNTAKTELAQRLESWKFDLGKIEIYEVIGGLLARQVTLATDIAMSPLMWNSHSAPVLLRAMADVHITLSWIFKDRYERSKQYIEHGIGGMKLEIAHRKRMIEEGNNDPELQHIVDVQENWLGSQRISDLVQVDLGNWSGLSVRKMAEESDCLDFYNYVYQPFSNAVHSSWSHISMHNVQHCKNPVHCNHRIGVCFEVEPDVYWLHLAAKYLEKSYKKFDLETGVKIASFSAYEQLCDNLSSKSEE